MPCATRRALVFSQFLDGVHAEGDVVDPQRRVGRGQGLFVIADVEEGDERTILQAKEEVRVGAVLARAGHVVALDDVIERQAQDVLVEVAGLLGIAGLVGVVVQLLHGGGRWQCGQVGTGACVHRMSPWWMF